MTLRKAGKPSELKYSELRWKCNPKIFSFDTTGDLEPIEGIVGQEKALSALQLGVTMKSPGYNIYISGLSGTGKATTVKKILESMEQDTSRIRDYAYVNNFKDPDSPRLLIFNQGEAKEFKFEMEELLKYLQEKIPQLLESESYTAKRNEVIQKFTRLENEMVQQFEARLKSDGFALGQVQVEGSARPEIMPVIGEQAVTIFQMEQMVQEGKFEREKANDFSEKYDIYQQELIEVFKKGMKLNQELRRQVGELERNEIGSLVNGAVGTLKEKYDKDNFVRYFTEMEESILGNLQIFKGHRPETESADGGPVDYFREYAVNILLDNSAQQTAPVIIEINPTYTNLFGSIEKIADGRGGWYADFTRIKGGSLLKANGGYIVINVHHLFEEPGVWRNLKRILTYRKLEIQDSYNYFQLAPSILKPEPIDINAKVILIGNSGIYSLLSDMEDGFKKIFKVKVEFDYEVDKTGEVMIEYARVIKRLCKEEGLLDFDKSAIAYLLELAARYAGGKEKLTSRFSVLADIAREADYWARSEGKRVVSSLYVKKAYENARGRHGLYEEKMAEYILKETILISTSGEVVGQVNGLAVYGGDVYSFGKPARISSSVSIGNGAIVNVEREAGLSGKSHDKGVLIINGFFREKFGQRLPLSFAATLVFEQSYGMIDGDSASSAEVFVLISAITQIPLKQYIAVTGSVNQKGEIQPIGGVNQKIEGFFDVCHARGLTKEQGVIIPEQNVRDLMLRDDIVEAVRKKNFHIYPIRSIDEGLEILTGYRAGKPAKNGHHEAASIYAKVEERLRYFYETGKNPFKKEDHKKSASEKKEQPLKIVPAAKKKQPVKKKKPAPAKPTGKKGPKRRK